MRPTIGWIDRSGGWYFERGVLLYPFRDDKGTDMAHLMELLARAANQHLTWHEYIEALVRADLERDPDLPL